MAGGSLENYGAIPEEVLGSIVVSVSSEDVVWCVGVVLLG